MVPLKTIVIDNGSTDGSQEIIQQHYPEVNFIQSKENIGFGRANNIGIKQAYEQGAEYVFLLNQDAWIEPDTIGKLVQAAEKQKEFAIISPLHLNGRGTALDKNFSHYISPKSCPDLVSDNFLNRVQDRIYETSYVNAAAWLVSRKCIETVGGFNPVFHVYGEDDNYMQRVHYHGMKMGVYPFAQICHDREDRVAENSTEYQKKTKLRELLIRYSNPLKPFRLEDDIKLKKKGMNRAMLKLKVSLYRKYQEEIALLESLPSMLKENYSLSKEKGLTFLTDTAI